MSPEKLVAGYHHGDLRHALIDAAVGEIGRQGLEALNLRTLAARAGVTSGAPYHHFADRKALLRAIAEEGFGRLEAELVEARDASPENASRRLEALGAAYMRFAIANPGYFRVMFRGETQAAHATEAGLRAFRCLTDAVVACQAAGVAPDGDSSPLVMTAWSTVHGFATLWVDAALPFQGLNPETMAPRVGRMIAKMLAALAREPHGDEPDGT
ncbi:MAG TPA: TetR/AcrR family transcriptional regulator [Roseiarcus sp.]|nr:TetR/AcrR family transcriptional regulator [Roseiarcus sp.]